MRLIALCFLSGTVLIQGLTDLRVLNHYPFYLAVSLFVILSLSLRRFHAIIFPINAFLIGVVMAAFIAQYHLNHRLPVEWEGQELLLVGKVLGVPDDSTEGTRLILNVSQASLRQSPDKILAFKGMVKLGWYQQREVIHAGETWQLRTRLKRPSGFMNPGGFDYEKWLFTKRIMATGYIRQTNTVENKRLKPASMWSVDRLREKIHQHIQDTIKNKEAAAIVSALLVAIRTDITEAQWEILQQTGTSHLMAISGLHIAVVAGFAFLPIWLIWRLFPWLNQKVPVRVAGGMAGVLFALVYALLAGFTLPTQRAFLMVVIALTGLLSRKQYKAFDILALALIAVLILDPLAGMSISFWLSFSAVALILIVLKRQLKEAKFTVVRLQLLLSLSMLPLTLLFFGSASLASPLANLLAIPWVSFVVVPMGLLGLIFMPLSTFISDHFLQLAALNIDGLFRILGRISELPFSSLNQADIPSLYLIIAFIGFIFLLLPKGFPGRYLGWVAFIPAMLFTLQTPLQGAFTVTLLDVGQGMASVVQTRNHTLIYDVGTRVSERFDLGKLVVLPFLKAKGIHAIDTMVLSHNDIDHTGGARTVLSGILTKKIMSSEPQLLRHVMIEVCHQGQTWQWDGVTFEILSPDDDFQQSDNNRSCVLRVSNQYHSVLLTADIEVKAEKKLIKNHRDSLLSEVMSVPHHGSKTSSSPEFIKAVSPQLALIPVGYRNRFKHPRPEILQRYRDKGIKLMNTVHSGAITLDFSADATAMNVSAYRQQRKRFWHR